MGLWIILSSIFFFLLFRPIMISSARVTTVIKDFRLPSGLSVRDLITSKKHDSVRWKLDKDSLEIPNNTCFKNFGRPLASITCCRTSMRQIWKRKWKHYFGTENKKEEEKLRLVIYDIQLNFWGILVSLKDNIVFWFSSSLEICAFISLYCWEGGCGVGKWLISSPFLRWRE